MDVRRWRFRWALGGCILVTAGLSCGDRPPACADCDVLVIGAVGEPTTLLPPLVMETVGRDIGDLVFERLASLRPGGASIDTGAYAPGLADRWEQLDPLTWRFHLRPNATWHDGRPVTAEDVVFSFKAYTDSVISGGAPSHLDAITATADDSASVRLHFSSAYPEQLYDATYHVRVIPKHIWGSQPVAAWEADTTLDHLVGSGPYRVRRWTRGESLELQRETMGAKPSAFTRVIWRFTGDPDAALNLLLAHEIDALETVGGPEAETRVAGDTMLRLQSYPSAVYGFLAFRVADASGRPHPVLGNRTARRALAHAVDRATAARAVFGKEVLVPPGPMSRGLWIWDSTIGTIPFDTAETRRLLDRKLPPIDILVPASSGTRRQLAQIIQEAWRRIGIDATITVVDFPIFQERLAAGKFDSYIGAYLDEPSPRGLKDQWARAGWSSLNYGHYHNPRFDALLEAAGATFDPAAARARWREAMDTLNADAPAIFLFTPAQTAAFDHRLETPAIDPYAWASTLPAWSMRPKR